MDNLDYIILNLLKQNSRIKASQISKDIHLSVSTVIERIKKMESSGIIDRYTTMTNGQKLGNDVSVLMEVSIEHERYNENFSENIRKHPNVEACYYITGDFDFNVKISCRSSEQLETIHKWIKNIRGVRATRTHYVLKTVKESDYYIPKPDDKK
ncbi:MAG: Lrp/AsnC family transcriptional regulator [Lachnotalea sp.]